MYFLAFRYLLSKKRQTLLILLGVMLGTAAYVAISGMMLGFQKHIFQQLVENDAHIRISAREENIEEDSLNEAFFGEATYPFWFSAPSGKRDSPRIEYPQGWFERFDSDPHVTVYSPQLSIQVIVRRANVTQTATLLGSYPDRQSKVTNIADYMVEGHFSDMGSSGNRIIVGSSLLKDLGAKKGESIFISAGKGDAQPFKIVGVFETGMEGIDRYSIFAALADVQKLNQTPSYITDIAVRLADVTQAHDIAAVWNQTANERVRSWDQINSGVLSIFRTQNLVRNFMTISILIVAGFGIYNVLNMLVNHKRHEIAIMRSVGYGAGDILKLFLLQGVVIGTLGGIFGLIIGYGICLYISTIQIDPGRVAIHGRMVVTYDAIIYVKAFSLAFLSCLFASIWPARSAGKLTPIEVIRSE